ncbi:hypothetical protein SAG0066_01450 [Streptococcus agalactiae CCUG 38383]|nr:hypothetical protein SAG0066_01450 [Streptococcus agalactiae CCUG 38383]
MEMVVLLKKQLWQVSDNTNHQKNTEKSAQAMLIVKKKTLKHMMNIMTMKKQIMHM